MCGSSCTLWLVQALGVWPASSAFSKTQKYPKAALSLLLVAHSSCSICPSLTHQVSTPGLPQGALCQFSSDTGHVLPPHWSKQGVLTALPLTPLLFLGFPFWELKWGSLSCGQVPSLCWVHLYLLKGLFYCSLTLFSPFGSVAVSSPWPASGTAGQFSSEIVVWLFLSKTSVGAGALDREMWGAAAHGTETAVTARSTSVLLT